ncbi:MAG: hypothetical protein A2W28_06905 [Gammaproteobacteria bacterium RBG_16_51_14]|nr:MAG: hypothetical protein A2W28_06905 [Gammaproteobacteria bacterium RBG_16_51_14]
MSSFLTQEGNPFFSGTYYPPEQFKDILQRVNEAWETRRELIQDQSEQIMTGVRRAMASRRDAQRIDLTVINQAVTHILAHYDRREGGFGQAPKFPNEPYLFLLLEAVQRNGDMSTLTAIEHSLNAMARGGIYDQIGGGFHRYSTDNRWLVPHFEKMLYNQANLVRIYLRAYQITGKPEYARIARETLDYILREMTSPEGGFYSATDADSEGGEGNFFLWDINQIENALPPAEAELAIGVFNITPQGNFEGRNILYLPVALQDYASRENLPLPELSVSLERLKAKLRLARNKRPAPLRDDKIITAWNGMMISAFADAAMIFQEPRYLDTAVNAANYILTKNRDDSGRYWRASLGDHTSIEARQEDYACFAEALVSLYDRTNHLSWLAQAEKVTLHMIDLFWDTEAGGFFMNAGLTESLLPARPKEASDSASPSGNSVALRVLTKLARRTGKEIYLDHAEATLAAFSSEIKQHPHAHSYLLTGTAELLYGEQNTLQYGSRGNVVAEVTVKPDGHAQTLLTVTVRIAPGWHINAHQPLDRYLKATGLRMNSDQSGWHLYDVEYPSPLIKKLGFQQDELALYENNIEIRARIGKPGVADSNQLKVPPPVHLDIQACNDELCLPPESLVLSLFPVQFSRDMEGDD